MVEIGGVARGEERSAERRVAVVPMAEQVAAATAAAATATAAVARETEVEATC
jgi:hypothetical protein